MKRIFSLTLLLGAVVLLPVSAYAKTTKASKNEAAQEVKSSSLGIVAVVNEEVVTTVDVGDRIKFIITTAKLSNTSETLAKLVPQVTRQLIDEVLQQQDAQRLGIVISEADVNKAIDGLAASRGGSAELLYKQLSDARVPISTFKDQVRTQLAWNKVIGREVRPKVKVSDEEVELARLQESTALKAEGSGEVQTITLILPVDKPERDNEVKALAEKLVSDLRNGASFEDIASQLGGGSAPTLVWTPLSQLEPALSNALSKAVPGSVSNPARTADGYMIVKLLNRRGIASAAVNDSNLLLKDILLKLKPEDAADDAKLSLEIAHEVARYPGDCKSTSVAGINGIEQSAIDVHFVEARFSELSPVMQEMVASLSVGGVTEPFATEDGIRLIMMCERIDAPPTLASAEEIYTKLMNKKLELEAQKYMRNLRRESFIEFRQ